MLSEGEREEVVERESEWVSEGGREGVKEWVGIYVNVSVFVGKKQWSWKIKPTHEKMAKKIIYLTEKESKMEFLGTGQVIPFKNGFYSFFPHFVHPLYYQICCCLFTIQKII